MTINQNKVDYEDFDLLIDQAQSGYIARVIYSSMGEASALFDLPFNEQELSALPWLSKRIFRHLRLQPASDAKTEVLTPRKFGMRLYNRVVPF